MSHYHAVWLKNNNSVYAQATRNGIRVSDLRDYESFADKLRKLALDGAKRFEGFEYDVEADLEAYLKIIPRVLPLITDTVPAPMWPRPHPVTRPTPTVPYYCGPCCTHALCCTAAHYKKAGSW